MAPRMLPSAKGAFHQTLHPETFSCLGSVTSGLSAFLSWLCDLRPFCFPGAQQTIHLVSLPLGPSPPPDSTPPPFRGPVNLWAPVPTLPRSSFIIPYNVNRIFSFYEGAKLAVMERLTTEVAKSRSEVCMADAQSRFHIFLSDLCLWDLSSSLGEEMNLLISSLVIQGRCY